MNNEITKLALAAGNALMALMLEVPDQVCVERPAWQFHADRILGTSLDVSIVSPSESVARTVADAVRTEILRLDRVMSTWRSDSELSQVNCSESVAVSRTLFDTLQRAARWRETTNGAFDERLGAVTRFWQTTSRNLLGEVDERALECLTVDAAGTVDLGTEGRVVSRGPGIQIDLDGFAKGVIIDSALDAARRESGTVEGILINVGGDIRCWGRSPAAGGWTVGVLDPMRVVDSASCWALLKLQDKAVATSGRGDRDFVVGGRPFSHLLDPRTGRPSEAVAGVTVVADLAADADALATAFSVMPPKASLLMADQLPGVAASITLADGSRCASARWNIWDTRTAHADASQRFKLAQNNRPAQQPAATTWPGGYALGIQYELPELDSARYRRPYLAIWVTDEKRRAVRTILLLGRRPNYHRGNYVWSRQYDGQPPEIVDAVSRPTRGPGRYSAVWDGTDDSGRAVQQGTYTIHVEAAREYGGHSYASIDLPLYGGPLQRRLGDQQEFGAVSLTYGPSR